MNFDTSDHRPDCPCDWCTATVTRPTTIHIQADEQGPRSVAVRFVTDRNGIPLREFGSGDQDRLYHFGYLRVGMMRHPSLNDHERLGLIKHHTDLIRLKDLVSQGFYAADMTVSGRLPKA